MTEPPLNSSRETGLPGRDYLILPLISLLTVLVLLAGAELASRQIYADGQTDACLIHDKTFGVRFKSNCTAEVKLPESEWVTNTYNACGYRTTEHCGPKPPDTLRIAMIGSSTAFGLYVPYQQSISAQLGKYLTAACGQKVEVQNLASEYEFWNVLRSHFDLAVDLKPDAVIVAAGPTDIETQDPELSEKENELPPLEWKTRIRNLFADSRLRVVLQHLMYQDPDFYLSLYRNSPAKTLYMREPLSDTLRIHLNAYNDLLSQFAAKGKAAGIPIMLAFIPQRAQVGFAADKNRPSYIDPFALNKALAKLASLNGVLFTDTTPDFVKDPRQMDLFLRADGHLDPDGDEVVARSLANTVVQDFAPFKHCASPG